ncbi:MAG: hypothetical protein OXB86_02995 [Bdellovibrionales bacterium]|nr:hypothetical protein [Bdellovibrionales bacterium]
MLATVKEKVFKPSHGDKAFLYQQAAELNTPVVILTGKSILEGEKTYSVTFVVDPDHINMKVKEQGATLFDACRKAKDSAKKQLFQLASRSATDKERELLLALVKYSIHIQ